MSKDVGGDSGQSYQIRFIISRILLVGKKEEVKCRMPAN